jgi:hypothetical protein
MKLRVWLQRYGSAEVAGIAGTFGGFYLSRWFTANPIVSAYAGALGENVGFYGFIIGREIQNDARAARRSGKPYGLAGIAATMGHLGFEFGVAEAADALIVRPFLLGLGTRLLGNIYGLLAGKIAADIIFYLIAMFFHGLRRKEV